MINFIIGPLKADKFHFWLTKQWQGGRAIWSRSTGFHATISIRRSFGLVLIVSITFFSWSTPWIDLLTKWDFHSIYLSSVVVMHSIIFGSEVSPLKAVNWPEVPFFPVVQTTRVEKSPRRVGIPNAHFFVMKLWKSRSLLHPKQV